MRLKTTEQDFEHVELARLKFVQLLFNLLATKPAATK